jgi:hypothetical protein
MDPLAPQIAELTAFLTALESRQADLDARMAARTRSPTHTNPRAVTLALDIAFALCVCAALIVFFTLP